MSEATPGMIPVDTHHGDDVNITALVVWGFVSVVITLAAIMGLHSLYGWYADGERAEKSYGAVYAEADNEILRQEGALQESIRWLDQERTSVGVPINRAMELTIEQYQQDK